MPDRPTASRRAVLRTGVSLAAVGATTVTASSPASASHLDHQPAHVSLSYDKAMLKQYRPRLATGHLDFKPNKLYSWVAESPEHDTTVCVYCASYDAQHGLSPFAGPLSDSHDGDIRRRGWRNRGITTMSSRSTRARVSGWTSAT